VGENSKHLRVLGWNIHHGAGSDGKVDLDRLAAVIRAQDPDLVMLHEVDVGCRRSGGGDQPAELARLTGTRQAFGKAMDFGDGEYGQMILSRFPLSDLRIHRLPGEGKPRIAFSALAERPIGPVTVASIHFNFMDKARQQAQAQVASAAVLEFAISPVILTGDFNAGPDSKAFAVFGQSPWSVVEKADAAATHPAEKPCNNIDFTVVRGFRAEGTSSVIFETIASDHRPILTLIAKPE